MDKFVTRTKNDSATTNSVATDQPTAIAPPRRIVQAKRRCNRSTKVTSTKVGLGKKSSKNSEARSFRKQWLDEFSWLEYSKGVMYCKLCRAASETTTTFGQEGSRSFKRDDLSKHSIANCHKELVLLAKLQKIPVEKSKAKQTLQALHKKADPQREIQFRIVHGLSKKGKPWTDYTLVCDIHEANGVDIGTQYRNDKMAAEFAKYIAESEMDKIKKEVEGADFFSVITDGTTDSSHTEAEIYFIRYCISGSVIVRFVAVKNVAKANAESLTDSLHDGMTYHFGETYSKQLVGLGVDGAAVMMGKKTGLIKRLQDKLNRPFIVGVHCSGHR